MSRIAGYGVMSASGGAGAIGGCGGGGGRLSLDFESNSTYVGELRAYGGLAGASADPRIRYWFRGLTDVPIRCIFREFFRDPPGSLRIRCGIANLRVCARIRGSALRFRGSCEAEIRECHPTGPVNERSIQRASKRIC